MNAAKIADLTEAVYSDGELRLAALHRCPDYGCCRTSCKGVAKSSCQPLSSAVLQIHVDTPVQAWTACIMPESGPRKADRSHPLLHSIHHDIHICLHDLRDGQVVSSQTVSGLSPVADLVCHGSGPP